MIQLQIKELLKKAEKNEILVRKKYGRRLSVTHKINE